MATAHVSTEIQGVSSDAVALSSQTTESLDYLASLFLELQSRAAKLYDDAYNADLPHEELKDRLIALAEEIGGKAADGSKVLRGNQYEIKLTLGESTYFDPRLVTSFRYALIRHGVAKGILTDIFSGSIRYQFTESAQKVLTSLHLPEHLRELYEQCRSRTPILTVSPV